MKSDFQIKVETSLARCFMKFFQLLPHRTAQLIGGILGVIFHDLVGIRRKAAIQQLLAAFPERSERWAKMTVRELYRHLGMHLAEVARIPIMTLKEIERWILIEGKEALDRATSGDHGCLGISAHWGAWEYNGVWAASHGYKVTYVVAKQANPEIEELVDNCRRSVGIQIIKRENATREVIKALKANCILTLMLDQDGGEAGVFVPFFNRLASTFRGAAVFALKMDLPIVLVTNRRLHDGRVVVKCELIEFTASGDRNRDVYELTAKVTAMLEEKIRKRPDEWLWLHRRWKTRPKEETMNC